MLQSLEILVKWWHNKRNKTYGLKRGENYDTYRVVSWRNRKPVQGRAVEATAYFNTAYINWLGGRLLLYCKIPKKQGKGKKHNTHFPCVKHFVLRDNEQNIVFYKALCIGSAGNERAWYALDNFAKALVRYCVLGNNGVGHC